MKKSLVLFSLISLFFSACKTNMQIEKPKESYLPSKISPALSELPLQIELDIKKLETAVNTKMTGLIYEGSNISGKDLSVKIYKAQNFTFTINNNVIEYRVPLKVWSRFAWKVEKFGISVGDFYEATGSIALTYKTTISLDKNWKMISKTSSSGYEWIETPKISVIGVNVPVSPIASIALSSCDKLISNQIDKALAEAIDLKKQVNQAWGELQKPRQVNAENNLWVQIIPKDIYLSPFSTGNNTLKLAVAFYGQVESFMGAKPTTNSLLPLPAYKLVNRPPQQFNLNIGADVTFDRITEMAKKELINKTFTEGKKTITITDLTVYGSAGKAVFVADVIGSLKGRIYFTGNMEYNPTSMTVEITEPEFELNTKNVLAKSANWLLHGLILKQMKPYLSYPVKDDLEKLKNDANSMVSNFPVTNGVNIQGKLNTISVSSVSLVPGAVRIMVNIKGNIAIKVQDLKF